MLEEVERIGSNILVIAQGRLAAAGDFHALRDLMDDYVEDPVSGRVKLQARLGDWFGIHFATFDARLHLSGDHPHPE